MGGYGLIFESLGVDSVEAILKPMLQINFPIFKWLQFDFRSPSVSSCDACHHCYTTSNNFPSHSQVFPQAKLLKIITNPPSHHCIAQYLRTRKGGIVICNVWGAHCNLSNAPLVLVGVTNNNKTMDLPILTQKPRDEDII